MSWVWGGGGGCLIFNTMYEYKQPGGGDFLLLRGVPPRGFFIGEIIRSLGTCKNG